MSDGLSDLQEYILRRAAGQPHLCHVEVLVGFFGWTPRLPLRYTTQADAPEREVGVLANPTVSFFSVNRVGVAAHRRGVTALNRACADLEQRGLLACLRGLGYQAVKITDHGRAWLSARPDAEGERG